MARPAGRLAPWSTVYTYWRNDGTWLAIHDRLRSGERVSGGRQESPSEAIVDSQSVPTATMVHEAVGYDGAKQTKGRKRHTVGDTLGLLLRVVVTAASMPAKTFTRRPYQRWVSAPACSKASVVSGTNRCNSPSGSRPRALLLARVSDEDGAAPAAVSQVVMHLTVFRKLLSADNTW